MIDVLLVDEEAVAFLRVPASDETATRLVRVEMTEKAKEMHRSRSQFTEDGAIAPVQTIGVPLPP